MTQLHFPESSPFTIIKRQPDFPNEDLTENNAAQIEYYLQHERGESAYVNYLKESLRMVHITGHQALEILGIEVDYSEKEYDAFCSGFAALEYAAQLVNPRLIDGSLAVKRTKSLLVDGADFADLEIADRFAVWESTHPNTYGVIVDAGASQGETMKQLHARAIGAQIAYEFQRAA